MLSFSLTYFAIFPGNSSILQYIIQNTEEEVKKNSYLERDTCFSVAD